MQESNISPSPKPLLASVGGILAGLYYVSVSVLLTLFNKLLFQRHSISPVLVLLSQCITTLTVLTLLSFFGLRTSLDLRKLSSAQICTHLPLIITYMCMLLFGMAALKSTSLLMYHSLRRSSIIPVILFQWHFERRAPTKATVLAAALIVVGGTAAITTNLRWEPNAYFLAFSANITTAYYLTRLKHVRDTLAVSNLQLLFLNNVYAFPLLLAIFSGAPSPTSSWFLFENSRFVVLFFCSSVFAIVLNHAVYVNTTVNGATAHTVSTQVKDVILFAASVLFVDDPKYRSRGMFLGAMVELGGTMVYATGKILSKSRQSKQPSQDSEEKKLVDTNTGST